MFAGLRSRPALRNIVTWAGTARRALHNNHPPVGFASSFWQNANKFNSCTSLYTKAWSFSKANRRCSVASFSNATRPTRPDPRFFSSNALSETLPVLSPPPVGRWLLLSSGLVFAVIVVGGVTRLTESGLSITEWRPITGVIPPLNHEQWSAEFEKYKATPEFKL